MTINMMLIYGAVVGLVVAAIVPRQRFGCLALLAVPIAMIVYVSRWQAAHPESLRSTSALDFIFAPLWPSLGAIAGYVFATIIRAWLNSRRDDGS